MADSCGEVTATEVTTVGKEEASPVEGGERAARRRPSARWVGVYLCLAIAACVLARAIVWLLGGWRGGVGAAVAWASDPFVYVFNRGIGLPTFWVGPGKIELGTLLALMAYTGTACALWFLTLTDISVDELIERVRRSFEKGDAP